LTSQLLESGPLGGPQGFNPFSDLRFDYVGARFHSIQPNSLQIGAE
jgi:hypothetical protein